MNIVLQQPTNMVHQQQVDQTGIVLAGFQDCTDEAIRYLVSVEHFPEQDPLIQGLRRHLWERQQDLDVTTLLQRQLNTKTMLDDLAANHHHHHYLPLNNQPCQNPLSPVGGTQTTAHCSVSEVNENIVPVVVESETAVIPEPQNEDVTQNVLELAMLAHNNPAIACLTEQIISLLDEEDDDDDEEEDSEYEEADDSLDTSGTSANTTDSQSAIEMDSEESFYE